MTTTDARDWKTLFRGAIALFALGMLGVLALAIYTVPSLRAFPELAGFSFPMLVVLAAANSTIILLVFVLLGTATAPQIGLQSHMYAWATRRDPEWSQLRASLRVAVGIGTVLFVVIAVLDVLFAPFVRLDTGVAPSDAEALRLLAESLPMRLFYGGITEELLLRWGLMAPIAWLIWRVRTARGSTAKTPSARTMWAAIGLSAVLFGLGHLPALAASFELTSALIIRTVILNAIAGVGFGWLFWRRSLEAAMIAHATFHIVLVAASSVLILIT